MAKKTKTIKISGNIDYSKVTQRILEFRQANPRGDIQTAPTILEDGQVMFKATVVKDKKDESSASATGHSLGLNKGVKAFEKLETIAVGRALAMLGYASDGEIASAEEMEEFEAYQQNKKAEFEDYIKETLDSIDETKTVDDLQDLFINLTPEVRQNESIQKAKLAKYKQLLKEIKDVKKA
jgi:hypothetical protein